MCPSLLHSLQDSETCFIVASGERSLHVVPTIAVGNSDVFPVICLEIDVVSSIPRPIALSLHSELTVHIQH